MAIEALLERIAVGLEANTAALQVLEAGRQASLDQLKRSAETGETAPRTRRKTSAAAAAAEPAATDTAGNAAGAAAAGSTAESPAASPSTAPAADGLSAIETELKAAVTAHIEGAGEDAAAKKARVDDITAIMQHFGGKLVGPASTLDDEQKGQALFYVRRYAAGCKVDFGQDYDFSGDPTQDGIEAGAGDEFNIG